MTSLPPSAARLSVAAQDIPIIGLQRARLLQKLNLRNACDILFFFPRDYRDSAPLMEIDMLREGRESSVLGVVEEIDQRNTGVGRSMLGVLVRRDRQYLRAVWFNQPYMRERFRHGERVLLTGSPRLRGGRWEMAHPQVEFLREDEAPPAGQILPIYALTEGLRQSQMRKIAQEVAKEFAPCVEEAFPESYLEPHDLRPISEALLHIHWPPDRARLEKAKQRFIYQELFALQLALAVRRRQSMESSQAVRLPVSAKIDARIRRLFPFELTEHQRTAIEEISADMGREHPMNRLLQGDVGSGKTVVAEYAMLLAVAHGAQAALMAPTEVLARQHVRTLERDLCESRVRIGLLTGSLTAAERRDVLEQIAEGEIDLVVGTHALLEDSVQFARLGLVVIDEQHKFGVRQRAALRRSEEAPHYLVMTATPIPRTVSLTLFGDLDVSTLRHGPPGRHRVHTYLGEEGQRKKWWDFFRRKLREGRQGYVVAPQVQGSELEEVASVEQLLENLSNGELEEFRLGLVHGRMSAAEKDAIMQSFYQGETQVLVATSVVEVGVDAPNATVMTIESGQRFGLAQLHQLRGRICRGSHPGYLCVFAEVKTDEARQRLQAFEKTTDGFELAEADFQMRGPGDLLGWRQHGLPPFRMADLIRDQEILDQARRDAQKLANSEEFFDDPDWDRMRRLVWARYGKSLELAEVG